MTTPRDPDRLLAAYLADGMEILPDRVADAVLAEVHRTRQRAVFGPRRTPYMNTAFKMAIGAAAVVAIAVAGINLLPGQSGPGGPPTNSASPVITPSASPSPSGSPTADRMKVGGTDQEFAIDLPNGWENNEFAAGPGDGIAGEAFFVSVPANTFPDPCVQSAPGPEIDRTIEAVTTAIRDIPGVSASEPSQLSVAAYDATYVELRGPSSLPCREPYLWLDSPGGGWWITEANQIIRVYVLDVDGQPVVISARSGPNATDEDKAALLEVLDTVEFSAAP